MRLDIFTLLFISCLAFISVPLVSSKKYLPIMMSLSCYAALNAGLIGLALAYCLSLIMNFQHCNKQSAEVESLVSCTIAHSIHC